MRTALGRVFWAQVQEPKGQGGRLFPNDLTVTYSVPCVKDGFLQCFDTVGLVIWPVKIVPDMTYNVFGGTLSLAQSPCEQW